jgi:hypothetical protein
MIEWIKFEGAGMVPMRRRGEGEASETAKAISSRHLLPDVGIFRLPACSLSAKYAKGKQNKAIANCRTKKRAQDKKM